MLALADGSRVFMKSEGLRVELNAEMRSRVDALLGPGNLRLIASPPGATPPSAPPDRHGPWRRADEPSRACFSGLFASFRSNRMASQERSGMAELVALPRLPN